MDPKYTREYIDICTELDETMEQLMNCSLEIFTLNPEIARLTAKVKQLRLQKAELEDLLYEECES